jgi:hypothetical protein
VAITHQQIGDDEDLAREVLVVGHSIAPCLASFTDGSEEQKNGISILKRVYRDIAGVDAQRGSRMVKSQRIGPAAVDYGGVTSAFEGDPTRALRALCASGSARALPVGSFPAERPLGRTWPEKYE